MDRWPRIVVHADMDAFYAAVEQRDHPELRGKPVLIGPNSYRGVVLTASYEARPFGVGSAMPVAEARRRCPAAIMVPPNFDRYQTVSKQIMDIFADFSPSVEAISLDEAFLDMTGAEHLFGSPVEMGRKLKAAVFEATELHISVGISGTKYVAKVASAFDKPNGLTIVPQQDAVDWLAPLPVSRLWGVGRKTAPRLTALGLHTIGDVAAADEAFLRSHLGSAGIHFHELAHARDPRRVLRGRGASSIGSDRTLDQDVSTRQDILVHLRRSAERIARRMRAKDYVAGGIRVRLKTSQHELLTRQRHLSRPDDTAEAFLDVGRQLLDEFHHPGPFRLVGMAAFDLSWRTGPAQMDLFSDGATRQLETTIDDLIKRFGKGVVTRARDLGHPGTVSDSGIDLDFMDYRDGERVSRPDG
ncbi:MAG: DNA polymerase IV [Proteobacteria bacterium]|jgi:DNA polymerase-4|nr:DNA polymerase IV [Pseudomonadota bacterium]MDA1302516.1 DNA polymerase IV [Pseudomonadota bacterium]